MYTDATEIVFFLALLLLTKFFYVVNLQNETDKDIPTISLLICALISENQGLEKLRSASIQIDIFVIVEETPSGPEFF